MTKHPGTHYSYEDIHRDCLAVAEKVQASGYRPEVIVAIATGGLIPGRILKSCLKVPLCVLGVALYDEAGVARPQPRLTQPAPLEAVRSRRVLLVDEVDDSRVTLAYAVRRLNDLFPSRIAIAVLHNKLGDKEGVLPADLPYFSAREVEGGWIHYPWDSVAGL